MILRRITTSLVTIIFAVTLGIFANCSPAATDSDSSTDQTQQPDSTDTENPIAEAGSENNDTANNDDTISVGSNAPIDTASNSPSSTDTTTTPSTPPTEASPSTSATSTDATSASSSTTPASSSGTTDDSGGTPTSSAPTPCGDFSFTASPIDIGTDLNSLYEPSGADWHESLNKLLLVSDEGIVSMMDKDGTDISNWTIGGDLEGVTIADDSTNFIYLGDENPDSVKEFNFVTGSITRTFDLTTWMTGASNSGLEALTFVPDDTNPEGGYFYAGHQGEGRVYVFELPIKTSSTSTAVTFITSFVPVSGWTDISDMDYDAGNDEVDVIYDGLNKLISMTPTGTVTNTWSLPQSDQEGFARNANCDVFIAQDSGKMVWAYIE